MSAAAARNDPRSLGAEGNAARVGDRAEGRSKRRRLLVALPVTGRVAAEIDGLRRAVGSSSLGRIEPHVTLVPPINVREDALADVFARVREQASVEPVAVVLGPARTFAPRTPVVYLEVGGEIASIDRLRQSLSSAPLASPSSRRERPFVAHVTIASGMDKAAIPAALETFRSFRVETTLSHLTLYEQDPTAPRHAWHRLADAVLGSATRIGVGGRELTFISSTLTSPDVESWADLIGACSGSSDRHFAIVALESGKVVGLADGGESGDRVEVRRFVVAPERRREGIGGQLLSTLERDAATKGRGSIAFFVSNDEATNLFLSGRGYKRAATLSRWRADRDVVVFERRFGISPGQGVGTG